MKIANDEHNGVCKVAQLAPGDVFRLINSDKLLMLIRAVLKNPGVAIGQIGGVTLPDVYNAVELEGGALITVSQDANAQRVAATLVVGRA